MYCYKISTKYQYELIIFKYTYLFEKLAVVQLGSWLAALGLDVRGSSMYSEKKTRSDKTRSEKTLSEKNSVGNYRFGQTLCRKKRSEKECSGNIVG